MQQQNITFIPETEVGTKLECLGQGILVLYLSFISFIVLSACSESDAIWYT
jgi:hypothetical protein